VYHEDVVLASAALTSNSISNEAAKKLVYADAFRPLAPSQPFVYPFGGQLLRDRLAKKTLFTVQRHELNAAQAAASGRDDHFGADGLVQLAADVAAWPLEQRRAYGGPLVSDTIAAMLAVERQAYATRSVKGVVLASRLVPFVAATRVALLELVMGEKLPPGDGWAQVQAAAAAGLNRDQRKALPKLLATERTLAGMVAAAVGKQCSAPGCGEVDGGRAAFKKCGRCGQASYCSPECAQAHWPAHKGSCMAQKPA